MPKSDPAQVLRNTKHGNKILLVLGVIADASAVVTLIRTQFYLVVTVIALLSFVFGLILFVRRWKQPVNLQVVLAVIIMLAGAVTFALSMERTNSGNSDPLHGPDPTASPLSSGTPTPLPALKVLWSGDIRLTPLYGVDLENHGTVGGYKQDNIKPLDLYLRTYGLVSSTVHQKFFLVVDNNDADFASCDAKIKDDTDGINSLWSDRMVKDAQYCFLTDKGNTAWIRITDFRLTNSETNDYVSLKAKVWNR